MLLRSDMMSSMGKIPNIKLLLSKNPAQNQEELALAPSGSIIDKIKKAHHIRKK